MLSFLLPFLWDWSGLAFLSDCDADGSILFFSDAIVSRAILLLSFLRSIRSFSQPSLDTISVQFVDQSDPDFDIKELEREIVDKSSVGHWKSAVRKLKKLSRRFRDHVIPESVYVAALDACMANRMQGARASEPARKIMEQMVEQGYAIPEQAGNYCSKCRQRVRSLFACLSRFKLLRRG